MGNEIEISRARPERTQSVKSESHTPWLTRGNGWLARKCGRSILNNRASMDLRAFQVAILVGLGSH